MEKSKLRPAGLDEEALQILREAEISINRRAAAGKEPAAEIYLIALHRDL